MSNFDLRIALSGSGNNSSATESTLQNLLGAVQLNGNILTNLLNENKIDFSLTSVIDQLGNVFQAQFKENESTGVLSVVYLDAQGNVANPTQPVSFINSSSLMTSILQELQKGTDNNTYKAELIGVSTSKLTESYIDYKSITFTVVSGTANVTVDGNTLTYPITGDNGTVLGSSWTSESQGSKEILIDSTNGQTLVTLNL